MNNVIGVAPEVLGGLLDGHHGKPAQMTFEKYEPVECETSTAFIEDVAAIEACGEIVRALGKSSLDATEPRR